MQTSTKPRPVLERIAQTHLLVETLETRGRDHLDFYDRDVAAMAAALEAAYQAGRASARRKAAA